MVYMNSPQLLNFVICKVGVSNTSRNRIYSPERVPGTQELGTHQRSFQVGGGKIVD